MVEDGTLRSYSRLQTKRNLMELPPKEVVVYFTRVLLFLPTKNAFE
jgi:hypothetical protein